MGTQSIAHPYPQAKKDKMAVKTVEPKLHLEHEEPVRKLSKSTEQLHTFWINDTTRTHLLITHHFIMSRKVQLIEGIKYNSWTKRIRQWFSYVCLLCGCNLHPSRNSKIMLLTSTDVHVPIGASSAILDLYIKFETHADTRIKSNLEDYHGRTLIKSKHGQTGTKNSNKIWISMEMEA